LVRVERKLLCIGGLEVAKEMLDRSPVRSSGIGDVWSRAESDVEEASDGLAVYRVDCSTVSGCSPVSADPWPNLKLS
jgi:hypothetical protein